MATIDLIVLSYNQEDYTVRCFDSILKHCCDIDYRLVWVDNGSSVDSKQVVMKSFLKHKNRLSIFSGNNLGFVQGINLAIESLLKFQKTDSQYIAILNNDIEVTKNWLKKQIFVLESNKTVGAVGPISSAVGNLQGWETLFPLINVSFNTDLTHFTTEERASVLHEKFGDTFVEAPMGITCPMIAFFCTVFRREIFERVGYLDTAYGVGYADDDDFCRRIYQDGWKIAVALGSYVFHNHKTTFDANYEKDDIIRLKQKNKTIYERKFANVKVIERGVL